MEKYKLYEGFPAYKGILTTYNSLVEKIKNITTIEQAKDYQNKNMITVEINGESIEKYLKDGGTNERIEWIRYEEINWLAYVYCYIKDGEIYNIYFDVYCSFYDTEFIESTNNLTQERYYNEMENIINRQKEKPNIIGYEEELPDLIFKI